MCLCDAPELHFIISFIPLHHLNTSSLQDGGIVITTPIYFCFFLQMSMDYL